MTRVGILLLLCVSAAAGQTNRGELRLQIVDPNGLGLRVSVQIKSEANGYQATLATDERGLLDLRRMPYGIYQFVVEQPGFAAASDTVEINSSIAIEHTIQLKLTVVNQSIVVNSVDTLVDPDQAGAINQIGPDQIEHRLTSLPGRSVQELVITQPGWIYEGNAVLHPRGSEYQTQFVVDGIPLTDNRSPSFGPQIEADDVESLSLYTAGFPAEYGRKMGGVIEVNTTPDAQPGFRGQAVLSGGSYDSAAAFVDGQYSWGKNILGASASGSMTDHYLNPVVPENFSNTGTLGDFSANYERDLTPKDRLRLIVRHEVSRYDIPNELVQQAAGQRQNADNVETMGITSYQHTFSSNVVADLRGMVRDNSNDFYSNEASTPIQVFQNNWFREGYFKGMVTVNHGRQEWKFGVESDNTFLNENFRYNITDPTQFDEDTPLTFAFQGNKPDLEQSVFVQDLIHLGKWTINAGLRWDHYQLETNNQAVSPRVAVSRYFPSAETVIHFSYDRIFQTPSFENILLSNSSEILSLDPTNFLRLPVEPSEGNYFEIGLSKSFWSKLKLDVNYYRRYVNNYADDDQISNTTISFPIAFRKAIIYGAEGKLYIPDWHGFSGLASYSYMVGNAWYPVTGGLFLGDDATDATSQTAGHFPISQDQRNSVRGRVRYQVRPRFWLAFGVQYDSGLPFEFQGDPADALAPYGPEVISRVNFERGRIEPTFQINASAGALIYKSDRLTMQLQADGQNLTNVLNVIDFGGLFSGNAIGPSRSFALRLSTNF
jgi:TonB-dependent Receptor Plug Domain